jgi:hypothetical protein
MAASRARKRKGRFLLQRGKRPFLFSCINRLILCKTSGVDTFQQLSDANQLSFDARSQTLSFEGEKSCAEKSF